eukprot:TRINITY_DN4375_c0_g1_i1.p1 TRINITY_DN4375_c0_g1~~TRINITY_DN4375_c0_g1_i1.p1  ORF type:complete len:223 (-),score=93.00 TRINITY_DN4375_c0_g1_i1:207-875(-)
MENASVKAARAMETGVGKVNNSLVGEGKREQLFYDTFQLPSDEKVFAEYKATCISTSLLTGICYVTKGYFCFLCTVEKEEIPVAIHLSDVVAVKLAVAVKHKNGGVSVYEPDVLPQLEKGESFNNVIRLYTNDNNMHMFMDLIHFERTFNLVYFLWAVQNNMHQQLVGRHYDAQEEQIVEQVNQNQVETSNSEEVKQDSGALDVYDVELKEIEKGDNDDLKQ